MKNKSSQETSEPWDSVTDQQSKRIMDAESGMEEHGATQVSQNKATKTDQTQTRERNRKYKTEMMSEKSDSVPLTDRQHVIDQSQECVDVSSWMMGYPDEKNTSVGGADVDPQSEEGITNYERLPRKLCAAGKRTPRTQLEQLDTDSVERVNSELDTDNSNERIPAQTL